MKKVVPLFAIILLLSCNNNADEAKTNTTNTGITDSMSNNGRKPGDTVAKDLDNTANVPGGDSSTPVQ